MSSNKEELVFQMKQMGVVPVFYHPDVDVLIQVINISYRAGVRVFEFMHQRDNKGPRLFNYIKERIQQYPDLILGAGTVLDAVMTERYIQVGAQFIASPFLRPEMAEVCRANGTLWMPGCTTSADIEKAKSLGATVIGILPGNILGPDFVATVKRDFPDLEFIPSGITDLHEASLFKWFDAGALCIKLSAQLFPKEAITLRDWGLIEKGIFAHLKNISKIKSTVKSI
jgi:2-dehydro-3-deoxyphosphogluconate aldolase/(4S)-4-hydroxy-2-oxoglutarate aldolase